MPMIELLTMLYELRLDVEKQITFHGYKETYARQYGDRARKSFGQEKIKLNNEIKTIFLFF